MMPGVPPRLRPLAWTLAAFTSATLLHVDRLPAWISGIALGAVAARVLIAVRGASLPGAWVRAGIAVVLTLGVLATFRTLNGLTAGTALLVAMGALKLLETRARRDDYVMLAVALFLLLAACLDRQGLPRVPLYALQLWICCAALAVIAAPQALAGLRAPLALAGRALGFALPLALLLFLTFPRLQGGFWALPNAGGAVTGLSDEMSPGQIDALTDSDTPAFRVTFDGASPPPQERYWRGPVLQDFDGTTWRRTRGRYFPEPSVQFDGATYRYHVTLEPNGRNWWFALESVVASPDRRVLLTEDRRLITIEPVDEAVRYSATSRARTVTHEPLSVLGRRYSLALPEGQNPRALELAAGLRAANPTAAAFAQAVLAYFARGGFEYTLTPPKLSGNAVDEFLFGTRRGFCGHYASAFATLMRAGGVPARVVTGYLGGEWNPIGRYFLVKQSDAHAWVEIWLDGRGWTRVDPTGVVAPERLQRGLYDLLPDAASVARRLTRGNAWLAEIAQAWDALNTAWRRRVLEFGATSQFALLERLGFDSPRWQQLGALLGLGLVAWLAWMSWQSRFWLRVARPDALARAWRAFGARHARIGLARAAAEAPLAYAARIAHARPDLAGQAGDLARRYAALRFGPGGDRAAVRAFARDVRRLRIAPAPAREPARGAT
ncbi:MAG: transglutaminaseTgpA domain-containing protein [Steroidobacteraceae bacterium]